MPRQPKKKKLEGRKLAFALAYVKDPNGTRAARAAGYTGSDDTLATTGSRLLGIEEVWTFIDAANNRKIKAAIASSDEVLAELSRLGTYDISDITDENGSILPLRQMPEKVRRAISSVSRDRKGNLKFDFAAKTPALTVLAKHYKLTSDTIHLTGKLTLEDLVAGSQQEPE